MVKRWDMWYGHPSHHGNPNVTGFSKQKDVLHILHTHYIYTHYINIYDIFMEWWPSSKQFTFESASAPRSKTAGQAVHRRPPPLVESLKGWAEGGSGWFMLIYVDQKQSKTPPKTKYGEISDVFRKTLDINELMVKSWEGAMLWFIDNDCHQPNQITSQQNLADCPLNYTFIQHTYWDDHVITFVGSPFHKHPTSRTPQNCTCSNRYKYHQVPNVLMVRFYQYFTIHW